MSEKTVKSSKKEYIFFAIIAVIVIGFFLLRRCDIGKSDNKEAIALVNALNDSLRVYKVRDSLNAGTISVLKTKSVNDFLQLQVKDREIVELQSLVSDYKKKLTPGSSITKTGISTVIKSTTPTTIIKTDTVKVDSVWYIYPTNIAIVDSTQNKWIQYQILSDRDTTTLDLKVHNEIDVVIGMDKRKPFVDVILHNPYSTVNKLRTYQVSLPRVKKIGLGINTSYGVGSNLKPQFYIGVGLQYNFIRF